MPPLNVPLWHVEYLELKAVKTQQPQKNFHLLLTASRNLDTGQRDATRDVFLSARAICVVGLTSDPRASPPLIFLWVPSAPFEAPGPHSLDQGGLQASTT